MATRNGYAHLLEKIDKLEHHNKWMLAALQDISSHAAHGVMHGVPQMVIRSLRDKARKALKRPAPNAVWSTLQD